MAQNGQGPTTSYSAQELQANVDALLHRIIAENAQIGIAEDDLVLINSNIVGHIHMVGGTIRADRTQFFYEIRNYRRGTYSLSFQVETIGDEPDKFMDLGIVHPDNAEGATNAEELFEILKQRLVAEGYATDALAAIYVPDISGNMYSNSNSNMYGGRRRASRRRSTRRRATRRRATRRVRGRRASRRHRAHRRASRRAGRR
jgi:hypothetical protein